MPVLHAITHLVRPLLPGAHPIETPSGKASKGLELGRFLLRPVCIDRDAPLISRLAAEASQQTACGTLPSTGEPSPRGPGLAAELTSRPERQVEAWIAAAQAPGGERALGLISLVGSCVVSGRRYSLGWLLVHPEMRRQGLGRVLAEHACRRASELSAEQVWVETKSNWTAALAFWRSIGFREPRGSSRHISEKQ